MPWTNLSTWDGDFSRFAFLKEFHDAINERKLIADADVEGEWTEADVVGIVAVPLIKQFQEKVEFLANEDHGGPFGDGTVIRVFVNPDSEPYMGESLAWQPSPYGFANLAQDAIGASSWRRTTIHPDDPEFVAFEHGPAQVGDIVGVWLFEDLQACLNRLVHFVNDHALEQQRGWRDSDDDSLSPFLASTCAEAYDVVSDRWPVMLNTAGPHLSLMQTWLVDLGGAFSGRMKRGQTRTVWDQHSGLIVPFGFALDVYAYIEKEGDAFDAQGAVDASGATLIEGWRKIGVYSVPGGSSSFTAPQEFPNIPMSTPPPNFSCGIAIGWGASVNRHRIRGNVPGGFTYQ